MRKALFILLLLIPVVVIFSAHPIEKKLTVSFLDVGQGDAVLIESPTGRQVLIDGGATRGVLRALSRAMPLFDRTLDAVVLTHPDQDHGGGLSYVFERYQVAMLFETENRSDSPAYERFREARDAEPGLRTITPRRGQRILLGGDAHIDVLFPDREVSGVESNTASIILRVVYGTHEFLLTGDAPSSIETYISSLYGTNLESEVLKAGHHGSNTSSSAEFIDVVKPAYVVYSRGCKNRYGHPSPEVAERFTARSVLAFDTCENGTVTFTTDGKHIVVTTTK